MAIDVIVIDKKPDDIMIIVRDLRDQGYVQGIDFDFAYKPAEFDNFSGDAVHNRYTKFTFHNEKYATLFALKWAR